MPSSKVPILAALAEKLLIPGTQRMVDSISPVYCELARDYEYKAGQSVLLTAKYYKAARGIRYETWESGQAYTAGNRVSRKAAVGGQTYWRSYECILNHTAATDNAPGTGTDTALHWKKRRLANVLDDDSEISNDWFFNPVARKASVGAYHGNRLFIRADDNDNWARAQYSAPAKPERDAEIADLDFDGTDWAAVDDNDGDGGGWFTVPFSGKGDAIRAFYSFGNYLVIAGRWQSYVLSGTNEASWTLRKLGNFGAVNLHCVCEQDGLVYLLGRHGVLSVTDGTTIEPVAGMEKARAYIKDLIDIVTTDDVPGGPHIKAHDGYIFISFPQTTPKTMVYDPRTASWWETDLKIMSMAEGEKGGAARLWFGGAITGAATEIPCVFEYTDDPGNELYTDDDYKAASGTASTTDITWRWRSAWFQFGVTRNERRLRRAWALVGGEALQSVIVRLFRNFSTTERTTVTRTLTGQATVQGEFVEAAVAQGDGTYFAAGMRVGGTANALTVLHGVGIDTEPVRTRFHK